MTTSGGKSGGLGSLVRRMLGAPAPTLGCEISPAGITVGRWSGGARQLSNTAWRPLPEGALDATPLRENLTQPERIRESLAACLDALGVGTARSGSHAKPLDAALIIPDQAARLFMLDFDKLPRSTAEAIGVVRWRLKKSVPFDIESSAVSFAAHRRENDWQVISVVTPASVVQQYEQMLGSVGLNPTRVTLSSLAAMALMPEEAAGGSTLLVKMSPPWLTTVIVQGQDMCLFRTGTLPSGSGAEPASASILEALYPSFAYFQDTFSRALDRVYLCGLGEATDGVMEGIGAEMQVPAERLPAAAGVASSTGWSRGEAERYSAGLLGLLRE